MTTNNTNSYHQFLRMVRKMRKAQKDFFKNKSQSGLGLALHAEREVDKWLESVGIDAAKIKQMALFPEDAEKEE